jgi:hypothetical protein
LLEFSLSEYLTDATLSRVTWIPAFVTGRAMRALAPKDAKAQRPLSAIICGFDTVLHKEHPKRGHLSLQAPGQATSLIGTLCCGLIEVDTEISVLRWVEEVSTNVSQT